MKTYITYWFDMIEHLFKSKGPLYFLWILFLAVVALAGAFFYLGQIINGMSVTNLSDQVSWGAYVANFTFMVGVADAAVLLIFPAYILKIKEMEEVVMVGIMIAIAAMIMALLFIVVDLGRPDRFLHILPFVGRLNFPQSILAWDVIALNGYLLLNLHIPGYLLYKKYCGETPSPKAYLPFIFISIAWAVFAHTITAFLYSGLGGRPFWNTAILTPRFLVSAFAGGPAVLIIVFAILKRFTEMKVSEKIIDLLIKIEMIFLPLNLFLLGSELFTLFYTQSSHMISAEYLFFGVHGHGMLVPYIWTSITLSTWALIVFFTPKLKSNFVVLVATSALLLIAIWIEKGMGLLIPGQVPSPLGDLVEYTPSLSEFMISLGIWAFGALLFTLSMKIVIGIQNGIIKKRT